MKPLPSKTVAIADDDDATLAFLVETVASSLHIEIACCRDRGGHKKGIKYIHTIYQQKEEVVVCFSCYQYRLAAMVLALSIRVVSSIPYSV